ncbi:voltage-gated potassium channel [Mesobacillus persicus]|uniref:Voltage-gated potassium channel n=1 Tax=Mesobacillus persicus TaxID=930146 RepID=A0A1H8EU34_9BACI|nr:potassium channel protein [Mesobacillus persicus]SEN22989.1 voltage-gated potassium channel [Mesobacillus persicus]
MGILHRILSKLINISLWQASGIAVFLIILSSILMRTIEPETFPSYIDALWWTMTTLVTVGYGDLYPKTAFGQIFTMTLIYTFGIGAMGILVGKIFESFTLYRRLKEAGKLKYDGKNHYILIGSSRDKLGSILEEILLSNQNGDVVVIDHADRSPIEHNKVHFVSGNPADEEVLMQANILEAKSVAIFSGEGNQHAEYADGKTLLIASQVEHLSKKHNRNIYSVVEIKKERHMVLFEHANVDEFILSSDSLSRLMAQAAIHHGSSKLFEQLLSKTEGENLYEIEKKPHWITYKDAAMELFEQGATLISDGSHLDLARRSNEKISNNAKMFVICDELTYKKIK